MDPVWGQVGIGVAALYVCEKVVGGVLRFVSERAKKGNGGDLAKEIEAKLAGVIEMNTRTGQETVAALREITRTLVAMQLEQRELNIGMDEVKAFVRGSKSAASDA